MKGKLVSVLLVLVLLLTACGTKEAPPGDATGRVSLDVPMAGGRLAGVDALWAGGSGDQARGGTSAMTITIDRYPPDERRIRVGFFEEFAGAAGDQWRASGWEAAVVSSYLLGLDLSMVRIAFETGGEDIDGPSAGALLTVAILSNLLGHTINPEATMTGTINPDGTIGPVGGIPQKLKGAADAGKRLVLVPSTKRFDRDLRTGQEVDLVRAGRDLGIEVRLVKDIYEAYELLTGEPLPRSEVTRGRAEVPPRAFDRLASRTREYISEFQAIESRFKPFAGAVQEWDWAMQEAGGRVAQADQALRGGNAAAAYTLALMGVTVAQLIEGTMEAFQRAGDLPELYQYVGQQGQTASTKVQALLDDLDTREPRTASDAVALADAYGAALQGRGLVILAAARMGQFLRMAEEASKTSALPQGMTNSSRAATAAFSPDARGNPGLASLLASPQSSRTEDLLGIVVEASGDNSTVRVTQVVPGGPADQAGVQVGDRISAIYTPSGCLCPLPDPVVLEIALQDVQPGMELGVALKRGSQSLYLTLVAGAAPAGPTPTATATSAPTPTPTTIPAPTATPTAVPPPAAAATPTLTPLAIGTPTPTATAMPGGGSTPTTGSQEFLGPRKRAPAEGEAPQLTPEQQMLQLLVEASFFYRMSGLAVQVSRDRLDIGSGFGTQPVDLERVRTLGALARAGASANMNALDSILDSFAEELGLHLERIKGTLATRDLDYGIATATFEALQEQEYQYLDPYRPAARASAYAVLGGSISLYTLSSHLIAKYYSLGAQWEEFGLVTGVAYPQALVDMMDFGLDTALDNIGLARGFEEEPVLSMVDYEAARWFRQDPSVHLQLASLQFLWQSAMSARTLALLAAPAPQEGEGATQGLPLWLEFGVGRKR